ncbi:PAS domain S-box protein [Methanoplanus sp. FWC-SCC4]|uniref:histidine kinase n=1 Tax=Methanochimaera problematica TaxID=2609417 RepID=A0AA97I4A6_9EURY|nr:PAS domain S-box protein [Methanoplanus sp. FWC-SCC4]WOF16141.1 PAS domain S-box protein [Methanoplanus sp. FWC-SCC4]
MDKKIYSGISCNESDIEADNIPDSVVIIDDALNVVFWNKASESLFGQSFHQTKGKNILILLKDENLKNIIREYSNYVENIPDDSTGFFRKERLNINNQEICIDFSISSFNINETGYAVFIARDVSKQIESDFEKEYFTNIVLSSNDAIIGISLEGDVISWNPGAQRIYGYTSDEISGKNIDILIPEEKKYEIKAEIEKIRSGKTIRSMETERITKSGKKINVVFTMSPVKDKSGEIKSASIIASDITFEKEVFKIMIRYISEAAMRLKNPAEMVRLNLFNLIEQIKNDSIEKENLILNLNIQMKNTQQIVHNLRELNQAIIGSYDEVPDEYVKYFNS